MQVPIPDGPESAGAPRVWARLTPGEIEMSEFDVAADGVYLLEAEQIEPVRELHVVLNWTAQVERILGEGR